MTGTLTRHAYQALIDENIAWLRENTDDCLEQKHIVAVLARSVETEYGPETTEHPAEGGTVYIGAHA